MAEPALRPARPLVLLVAVGLCVVVSIGAIAPSAPFDGWSPPGTSHLTTSATPSPARQSGRPTRTPAGPGERALVPTAGGRPSRAESRRPGGTDRARALLLVVTIAVLRSLGGRPQVRRGRPRAPDDGRPTRWWASQAPLPDRAPPPLLV